MSPHVSSFVHDLVAMAQATERLPQLEGQVADLQEQVDYYARTVQDRELSIVEYKRTIDELQAKVRALEVERDDASFRVLEAEDQTASTISKARNAAAALAEIISALDPPKPEPKPEPIIEEPSFVAGSFSNPLPGTAEVAQSAPVPFPPTTETTATPTSQDAGIGYNPPEDRDLGNPPMPSPMISSTSQDTSAESPEQPFDPEPKKHDWQGFVTAEWYNWKSRNRQATA